MGNRLIIKLVMKKIFLSISIFLFFALGLFIVWHYNLYQRFSETARDQTQKTTNEKVTTNSLADLFKYVEKVDNSKLSNTQLEAWKVEINTHLLIDKKIKNFRVNLFDGQNYEVERNEKQMQKTTCDNQQCTWIGFIKERACIAQNTITGECSPGETIIFTLNNNTIVGTIPAVVGENQSAYSVGGMTNDSGPFLIKINASKFSPD